ncbi:hypothetical protein FJ364_04245, partial [Candidatus Dependentiae bacterium]|nr:hypothetical protein [Candidatus Dependentiae bacterium]
MKCLNNLFKRYAWLLAMLSILGYNTSLLAMDGDAAGIKLEIASIAGEPDWDEQIYALNDLLDGENDSTLDAATQQSLFDLITAIFNYRITKYKASMGTSLNLADLNLLLINARQSPLLNTTQQNTIGDYQKIVTVEQLILQNQSEKNFTQQVNNLSTALGSAGNTTFDAIIQSFLNQQLNSIFTGRTTQPESIQERINGVFSRAKTSTLVADSNKTDVSTKSEILSIESSLRKAAKDTVYANALKTLEAIQIQDQSKKFEQFTQDLNFSALSQMFNNRENKSIAEITSLIDVLTKATTTVVLTKEQQDKIAAMLASLAIEKSIIDAINKTAFDEKVSSLQKITDENSGAKPSTNAQTLYGTALQGTYSARPANNLDANNRLIKLLTAAQTSPLLAEKDKAMVAGWLAALQQETANLTVQDAVKKALEKPTFIAKVSDFNALFATHGNKTVTDDTKNQVFNGINPLIDGRPKNDVDALKQLKDMLAAAQASSLLTDAQKAQLAQKATQLDSDLSNALLNKQLQDILANPDYNARMAALQKFMADNAGKTLTPELQAALQKGLQDLIDKRPTNDPTALTNLANMLNGLGSSNLLSPDFKKQLTDSLLPAVNKDKDNALLKKQLQDILANPDYNARMAALQKFMTDNASKTLSPELQAALQKGLQDLTDKRPVNDSTVLTNLTNMLNGLGNSNLLSPDFKKQLADSLLPAVNKDKDNALLN